MRFSLNKGAAMLALTAVTCAPLSLRPAQAQISYGDWVPIDKDSNEFDWNEDGTTHFWGTATGSGSNTYPEQMVAYVLAHPATSGDWLHSFFPNPLHERWLYQGETIAYGSASASTGAQAHASNHFSDQDGHQLPGWSFWIGNPSTPGSVEVIGTFQGSASSIVNVNLQARLKYKGPAASRPPHINVLLRTHVSAGAHKRGPASSISDMSASASASIPHFSKSASAPDPPALYQWSGQQVQGRHLVRASVGADGTASVLLFGESSAHASNGTPWVNGYSTAYAGTSIGGSVALDNRDVTISCPVVEPSHFKGVNDDGDPVPVPHQRQPGGEMTADAALGFDFTTNQWRSEVSFVANAANFVDPTFDWRVDGEGASVVAQPSPDSVIVRVVLPYEEDANPLNQQTAARVDVTDQDGAAAANHYTVRWHLPYENWKEYGARRQVWNYPVLEVDPPGHAMINGSVRASWTTHHYLWGVAAEALELAQEAPVHPYFSFLFAAAGFSIQHYGPQSSSGNADFNACWGADGSTYEPDWDDTRKNLYRMTPRLRFGHTVSFWKGDAYDTNGYAGQVRKAISAYDGRAEWVGDFVREDPSVPDPEPDPRQDQEQ